MRAPCVAVLVNLTLMAFQLLAGWSTGAHAMLADGVHSLVDVAVDTIVALSVYFTRSTSSRHAEKLATATAAFVSVLVMATGVELFARSLFVPPLPHGAHHQSMRIFTLGVAIAGIALKAYLYRSLNSAAIRAAGSGNERSARMLTAGAWHACADSVSACVAAVGTLGVLLGFASLDRLAALLIGALIVGAGLMQEDNPLRWGYRLIRGARHEDDEHSAETLPLTRPSN